MALYRQIAGTPGGVPSDQVGLFWDGTSLNPGILPGNAGYEWTEPADEPIADPISPTLPVADSPFADPREFDPGDLTPIPTPTIPVPTLNPSQPVDPTLVLPTDLKTSPNNFLPILALAGVVLVAVAGENLLHEKRKIVFIGGIGLLYYGMAKNKI